MPIRARSVAPTASSTTPKDECGLIADARRAEEDHQRWDEEQGATTIIAVHLTDRVIAAHRECKVRRVRNLVAALPDPAIPA